MMRSPFHRIVFVGTLCLSLAGSTPLLFARKGGPFKTVTGKSKTAPANNQNQTAAPPPTTAPSPSEQAEANLVTAETKVKAKFEAGDDWTSAEDADSKARMAFDAAVAAAMGSIRTQPDYVEATENVSKAEEKLAKANSDGDGGSSSQIAVAATELMTARSALGAVQSKALAASPTVVTARQTLAVANSAVDNLRKAEVAAVQADPDWQAAKKAVDDARSRIASAQK